MKEKLYTIPLNDALDAGDECPLCFCQRKIEQDLMDFVLGHSASYMEADIREMTDKAGFCREHFKKMYDYGNTLGNAWILKTHYIRTIDEMKREFAKVAPEKPAAKGRFKKKSESTPSLGAWIKSKEHSCYICNQFQDTYHRYLDTFVYLWARDEEFRQKVKTSKGFCLQHFGDLCLQAETQLKEASLGEFYDALLPLVEENMNRMKEDISWLVEKFDYRNKDADWKNSRDAIQRGMQKMKGGYPADAPYVMQK